MRHLQGSDYVLGKLVSRTDKTDLSYLHSQHPQQNVFVVIKRARQQFNTSDIMMQSLIR